VRHVQLRPFAARDPVRDVATPTVGGELPAGTRLDFVQAEESWDEARGLRLIRRRAVRVTLPTAAAGRPQRLAWAASGVALVASAGLLALTVSGVGSAPPPPPPPAVEIELDAPAPARQAPPPAPAAKAVPIAVPPEAAPEAVPEKAAEPETREPEPLQLGRLGTVQAAFEKSVASGTAEPWEENGLSGYAVAGPANVDGEQVCRNLAILLRQPGSAGQVIDGRKCLTADGNWVDS
jgi:hypothetical protein